MPELTQVNVPDIGDFDAVDVVEVLVQPGDEIEAEGLIVTLESDKASMEIPAPYAGVVREVVVNVGDKVKTGSPIIKMEVHDSPAPAPAPAVAPPAVPEAPPPAAQAAPPPPQAAPAPAQEASDDQRRVIHASPAIRRFARELGVDLVQVQGTGRRGRIQKSDVQGHVKRIIRDPNAGGSAIPALPEIDFSRWGEVEAQPLTKINKLTAKNLHRSWLNVPLVTQYDEADITDLEAFRKANKDSAAQQGFKLTFLTFLLKATAATLRKLPRFNSSLDPSGENLILKRYIHIGVAVDTPKGLVVPVVRDVDQKGLFQLAEELSALSGVARAGKLMPGQMQGASFTISSLGGIGGTGFTPLVNAPEVAILGVSRSKMQPVFVDGAFVPRLMLPFSLSYDHRVIDGAAGARFTSHLSSLLSDFRRVTL